MQCVREPRTFENNYEKSQNRLDPQVKAMETSSVKMTIPLPTMQY